MEKKETNAVHLHGFVNNVNEVEFEDGTSKFIIDMATQEIYTDNTGETKKKTSYHDVVLFTGDQEKKEAIRKVADDLKNNYDHKGEEGFKPVIHKASVDGKLVTKVNTVEVDGEKVDYYNNFVVTSDEQIKIDQPKAKDERQNIAEFEGNIANVIFSQDDRFAIVKIATHFYVPGESKNYKGVEKPYTEKTSYIETRLSANYRKTEFANLKDGKIAKGDLVKVRGMMHNAEYVDKNDIKRYKIVVDLNKIEIVAKKKVEEKEKKAETAEKPSVKKARAKSKTR